MKFRSLVITLILAAIVVFAALNWNAIMTPTVLSLGIATIEAPLGLIMLGMLAVLTACFLAYIVFLQSSVLLESRRHARELQTNRELADQAEASRFTELRKFIEAEMHNVAARDNEAKAALLSRLDSLDHGMRTSVTESSNSLAAYIGELEDRLDGITHRDTVRTTTVPVRREH
jgi:uncharacterized integral membrane protein